MSRWSSVEEARCFGVVISNFETGGKHTLRVWIGETVHIRCETTDWYLCTKINDGEQGQAVDETGTVPKTYVHVQEAYVLPIGDGRDNLVIPRRPPLVQEITDALREWHKVSKQLYVQSNFTTFAAINALILQLHAFRSSITSPELTVDGRRELRKQVAECIDTGNNLLKLDMSVRDEAGNALNPELTSTIELYRQHQKTRDRLEKKHASGQHTNEKSTLCIAVTCGRITWEVADKCQVRFYLYDADEDAVFTECALLQLNTNANYNQTQLKTRFLFTDLSSHDIQRNRVYLIAYVIRIGAMEYRKEKTAGGHVAPFSQRASGIPVRRPWGVGARNITHLLKSANKGEPNEFYTSFPFMPFTESDSSLKSALIKCVEGASSGKDTVDKGSFQCLVNVLFNVRADGFIGAEVLGGEGINGISAFGELGEATTALRDVVVRKMGFPEVILPNDMRNELYVRLSFGEFSRGNKTSDKNVQVTLSCHNDRGELVKGILYSGTKSGADTYNSVVYYHDDKPKWYEVIKVSLPMVIEEFSSTHLKFTFKHRSTSDSKDKSEKPFAMAYLKLRADKGTSMPDGEHKLRVFKIDGKQYRDTDVSYLALPSLAPAQPQVSSSSALKSHNQVFSWSQKDSLSIRTILCSTKFTQNVYLLELLQWSSKSQAVYDSAEPNDRRIHLGSILLQELNRIMSNVICVPDAEIVKFLPDVFDALFYVLVKPVETILHELSIQWTDGVLQQFVEMKNKCDRIIFDCLIYIFEVVLNPKYKKFKSVLTHYIEDGFTATLAYKQLIRELDHSFQQPVADKILKIMKSFEWFFKFIIRSFSIRLQLERMNVEVIEQEGEVEAEAEFEHLIVSLFASINQFVARPEREYLTAQGAVLRFLPSIIEPLSTVLSPLNLSELLVDLLRWVHPQQLAYEKLGTIGEVVRSSLFRNPDCRTTLQPIITMAIREHLPGNDNEMRRRMEETTKIKSKNKITQTLGKEAPRSFKTAEMPSHSPATMKCVEILGDMMDTLFRPDIGSIEDNITFIMHVLLQPLIQSIATIGDKDPVSGNMVAILLGLFRQMSPKHYLKFIGNLRKKPNANGEQELITFINELLITLKSLTSPTCATFPSTWAEMIRLQNSIILTVLKHFSLILKTEYSDGDTFVQNIWYNFFWCLVTFASQSSLCLEIASRTKRVNILNSYGDMRRTAAELTHGMWFCLGQSKRLRFVPQMVGVWLQMGFVRDAEIQKAVITILFDMMRCEFDEAVTLAATGERENGLRNSGDESGGGKSLLKMEDELVKRLVESIESGLGDLTFGTVFKDTMYECCLNDNSGLQQLGISMIEMLSRLIDLLLEYRSVIVESEIGNTMSCIVNLLDFSMEIGRKELYLRYLYKLHELHVKSGNFTEAAFTLRLHSRQLEWSEEECPSRLRSPLPGLQLGLSQWELKEALYYEIINYFDKAKMWECALEICDELRSQYADETYNYAMLSPLLQRMASFYNSILTGVRCDPEYFRVAFYGTQFPAFLQDKSFVYRGKEYEKLSEFEARMLERFPKAELLRSLNRPSDEIRNSGKQYLQICKVDPIMNAGLGTGNRLSGMKYADESIRKYYRSNNVNKFVFARPYHREPKDPTNEFASLWLDRYTLWTSNSFPGIMNWFPVIKECSQQVKPIVKAIETMEEVNEKLREMVLVHSMNPNEDLGSLTMKLSGILDAAVMGGISNYESAFLSPAYLDREPQDASLVDRLKTLICNQVPIVYQCLLIHERKAPESLADLHRHLQGCYNNLIEHMTKVYGVSLKNVQDESLTKDVERATRRKKAQSRRYEGTTASTTMDVVQPRHIHYNAPSTNHTPGLRGKGSFSSSTMSLYASKISTSKSKHRRSTQGSLDETFHNTMQNHSSTSGLHNSGSSSGISSMSKFQMPPLDSSSRDLNKSRDSGSFYPLTEQSQPQGAMSASILENRRSFTWAQHSPGPKDTTPGNRNSSHSLTTTISEMSQTMPEGTTTNSSSTSIESSLMTSVTEPEDELAPPPLPPKSHNQPQQADAETGPVPPKPPPKPPMRKLPQ